MFSSFAVGKELYDAYQAGDTPTVRLETSGVDVEHLYPQVVAETRRGDPDHVVIAGAHLDSVPAGPGINDDGSGTSWQLELAEQLSKLHAKPKHKIRFLWFGAEEDGLIGSGGLRHGRGGLQPLLPPEEQATLPQAFDGRSDYHKACDNISTVTGQPPADTMNVFASDPGLAQQQADALRGNALKSLREMSGAVTHAVWYFAQTRNALPPGDAAARERAQKRGQAITSLGHTRTDDR